MNVTCGNILKLPYASQLKLVAGKDGLNNCIRWVHYLEEPKYTEWLKGGELVIVSGLITNDDPERLVALIDELNEKHAAGVVINLSYYIDKIPQAVIDYGNFTGFPVFEMPAMVRIVDVSKSICSEIFKSQQRSTGADTVINDIIYGKRLSAQRADKLRALGYEEGKNYYAVVFEFADLLKRPKTNGDSFYDEDGAESAAETCRNLLAGRFADKNVLSAIYDEHLLWICDETSLEKIPDIHKYLQLQLKNVRIYTGISNSFSQLKNLRECVCNAEQAIEISAAGGTPDSEIAYFRDMIDLRIFHYIQSEDERREIAESMLGSLAENEELLHILRVYFKNNCNAKLAAEELFFHANTMHNKLRKAEQILNKDLSSTEDRFKIMLAIKLLDSVNR